MYTGFTSKHNTVKKGLRGMRTKGGKKSEEGGGGVKEGFLNDHE